MHNHLVLGSWNAICDVCGLKKKSYQLRQRWDGLMVCKEDFETRHPQLEVRLKPETIAPPWVRPEGTDTFQLVCDIMQSSPFADLAAADCAHADVGSPNLPYSYLSQVYANSVVNT